MSPRIGVAIPVSIVRAGMIVTVIGLGVMAFGLSPLLVVASLGSVALLLLPRAPIAWMLALCFAIPLLVTTTPTPAWRVAAIVLAVHALHEFGMAAAWLSVRGRVQRAVLWRLIRSFLLVQVPVQLVVFGYVTLVGGNGLAGVAGSPFFAVLAGASLVALVVAVLLPILRGSAGKG